MLQRPVTERSAELFNEYGNGLSFRFFPDQNWMEVRGFVDGQETGSDIHLGYLCELLGITPKMVRDALKAVAPTTVKKVKVA